MSDALPEDTWVNSFLSASPRPLQQALQKRQNGAQTHINALTELFKQRAVIESQYADSLSKLVKNAEQGLLNGKGAVDWDKSGGEQKIWTNLVAELQETSSVHSTLAAIIHTDFEQPIRDIPTKSVAWRRIGEQDAALEKALKDYEKTAQKLDKAQSKGGKSGKADGLASELNQITSNLSSLSPMVYTTYQRLDEDRLRALKEVVVRWGTARADMAQKDAERAERAVAVMISWETPEEVTRAGQNLARKAGATGGTGVRSAAPPTISGSDRGSDSVNSTPRTNRRLSTATAQTTDFSPRPQPKQNGSSSQLPSSGSSFAGGLKSMLSRRPTLGPSGRGRSDSAGPSGRAGSFREPSGFAAIGESGPVGRGVSQTPPPIDDEGFSVAPADRHRNPWEDPNELTPTKPAAGSSGPTEDLLSDNPPTSGFANTFNSSPNGSTDNISTTGSAPGQAQSRLNLALSTAPIQEDEADRQAAMEKMQQTLTMSPPTTATRRQTMGRGRRDVRNTVFAPAGEDGSLGYGGLALGSPSLESPVTASPNTLSNGAPPTKPVGLDRQASQSSIGSNNPFDSPNLMTSGPSAAALTTNSKPGLRGAVTETINVVMKDGVVKRLQINGEVYLSLRALDAQQPSHGPIHIRLSKFEALEKIAPNPSFVAPVPDKSGEYILNSEALASASVTASAKGTLAFKYQVFIHPGQENDWLPFTLEPAFLCKSGETRMILHYKVNQRPAYGSGSPQDVHIIARFAEGVSVSNVQAKPAGGVWSAASRHMTWDMGSLSSDGKIIAKFVSAAGEPLSPQGVQATWTVQGVLGSDLGLEVIRGELESDWTFEEVQKQLCSGKYLAEPILNQ